MGQLDAGSGDGARAGRIVAASAAVVAAAGVRDAGQGPPAQSGALHLLHCLLRLHRLQVLDGEGNKQQLNNQRQDNDGQTKIVKKLIQQYKAIDNGTSEYEIGQQAPTFLGEMTSLG